MDIVQINETKIQGPSRSRLEFLRSRVSLVSLAGHFTELRRCGPRAWRGLCPLHVETNPSFFVNPESRQFFCFGCGAGGDVYRFIEILCGCRFREAVRQVARLASGKTLSLPALAARQGDALSAGGAGGWNPPASLATRLEVARKAHRRAVLAGAARALLERERELPASMLADLRADSLLLEPEI